ncbi:MAG: hypothetical protein KBI47_22605 [Armatimonadetes bacterium]|nr:hypothetical protein [Armatimonadota bacterium]
MSMPRNGWRCALAGALLLGTIVAPGFCLTSGDFKLSLTAPKGWSRYSGEKPPHRFGGELLSVWEKSFKYGKALIYVVGMRQDAVVSLGDLRKSFAGYLDAAKITNKQYDSFFVASRPAVKFEMEGDGTGQVISALAGGKGGDKKTFMQVVMFTNPWHGDKGTDVIQFAMACHFGDRADVSDDFSSAIHRTTLGGRYQPNALTSPPAGPPHPPAARQETPSNGAAGEIEEPQIVIQGLPDVPEPMQITLSEAPRDDAAPVAQAPAPAAAEKEAGEKPRATRPTPSPQPQGPPADALFASLYTSGASVPYPVLAQFINGTRKGMDMVWVTPTEDRTSVYVLLWPDMRSAWVIPGADFRQLATVDGGSYVMGFGAELTPYLNAWEHLLAAAATR